MERMSRKVNFGSAPRTSIPEIQTATATKTTISNLSKWVPLLCAGAAAGVSIIALKEIKNVRRELIAVKKEQSPSGSADFDKRMKAMENQLKMLTEFIKNKDKVTKESEIIRNVVKKEQVAPVTIINDEEYEEVEVTDDEAENEAE
uniref:Uncharacterized protein n=1 Tax=viral metagenome TaxID=1070528 RepID=A0A6C0B051_9ZZZZ